MQNSKWSQSPEFSSDNLLKQEFNPKAPNQVWTTDFTYISIGSKHHAYLCAILDLYSRKCIDWKVSDKIDAQLACDTLELASYSKPGHPYDNAMTEVFFKYLKQREINQRTYHSIQEIQSSCFEYIEQFYNNYNPHSANNGLTPNKKDILY